MLSKYNSLPRMTYAQIQSIADMIYQVVNYILEEAVNNAVTAQSYELMIRRMGLRKLKAAGDLQLSARKEGAEADGEDVSHRDVTISLRPAITYVKQHLEENVSMEQMAKLCHLSPSYFSRLFTREMGETYSNYVSRLKIQHAKRMLETTNFTMIQIADSLGFSDGGYFTKVFKKFEGTTPAEYRKHMALVKTYKNKGKI